MLLGHYARFEEATIRAWIFLKFLGWPKPYYSFLLSQVLNLQQQPPTLTAPNFDQQYVYKYTWITGIILVCLSLCQP